MSRPPDLVTLGEAMVSLRGEEPLRQGSTLTARLAGAECTVAIATARLGHRTRWAGRLGEDPFGDLVVDQLRAEGVDVTSVVRDGDRPTGLMVVERRTADLARVEYRRDGSAGSALTTTEVGRALESGTRVVHLTGITPALSETARDSVFWAARAARRIGAVVSLDVNYRSRLWSRERARECLRQLAPLVDVIVASDDELDLLTTDMQDEAATVAALVDSGSTHVAVKRGARGATLWTADGRHDVAAVPVTAVDALGAGDAFSAGLLSGLLDGLPARECLARGAVVGAFAVSSHGDWEGLPRRRELHLLDGLEPGSALR